MDSLLVCVRAVGDFEGRYDICGMCCALGGEGACVDQTVSMLRLR